MKLVTNETQDLHMNSGPDLQPNVCRNGMHLNVQVDMESNGKRVSTDGA